MFDKATSTNAMAAKKGEGHMPSLRNVTRPDSWIRGVNIGGWLVLERWITPYLFALTNCHLDGEFCRYPQQVLNHKGVPLPECDLKKCLPISTDNVDGGRYPMDEYTLTDAFPDKGTARRYLEHHWDTFVTKQDIQLLRQAGLTHVRVPLGYWILGDVWEGEPYVDGGWPFFRRLVEWCREEGLQVWPDLHAAPGSQNGFDNSGRALPDSTSINWYNSTENVQRTLDVIEHISLRVLEDGLDDVVTGFGILNEVFKDADLDILRKFTNKAFDIVRSVLGNETAVYTGDSFRPEAWNDGWWLDETRYKNTFLDNHVYHGRFRNVLVWYASSFHALTNIVSRTPQSFLNREGI
jgi:glucan 1,3-beta-glucosidase